MKHKLQTIWVCLPAKSNSHVLRFKMWKWDVLNYQKKISWSMIWHAYLTVSGIINIRRSNKKHIMYSLTYIYTVFTYPKIIFFWKRGGFLQRLYKINFLDVTKTITTIKHTVYYTNLWFWRVFDLGKDCYNDFLSIKYKVFAIQMVLGGYEFYTISDKTCVCGTHCSSQEHTGSRSQVVDNDVIWKCLTSCMCSPNMTTISYIDQILKSNYSTDVKTNRHKPVTVNRCAPIGWFKGT